MVIFRHPGKEKNEILHPIFCTLTAPNIYLLDMLEFIHKLMDVMPEYGIFIFLTMLPAIILQGTTHIMVFWDLKLFNCLINKRSFLSEVHILFIIIYSKLINLSIM